MSKNTTKLVHATTFLGASATRSRIANCFCPKDEGRSLFCDASGMIVEIWGNRRSLRNDQFADVFSTQGWFWTTVSVVTTDGLTFKISGLPKTDARALVEMLAHNHLANVRQVAAQLFEHLDKADVEVARLTGGGRYVAAHMVRHLLSTVERLAPLTRLKIRSGMLAPDVETKLRRVADFIADHERKRSALNTRFIETELLAMRSFFDRVESNPLTSPQCRAVVADEDRNLVVAAAGSGKTSVIVAKVAYLIHKGQRLPNEILVMAFGKHASEEMSQRLSVRVGNSVTVKTFHALGLSIIAKVEGKPPPLSPLAEDEKRLQGFLREIIHGLLEKDARFAEVFLVWFQSHFAPYRSHCAFKSWGEYWQYVRDHDIRTLKGERVKSYEECEIANWLYLNGIEYEYERKYEHDTTTPERRQYKPDFYLPDLDVYVEHFAVDSNGNTPSFIDGQSYLEGISWKRATHEQFGTVLVETYSHEKSAGTLLSGLKAKLEALPGKVLRTDPVPFAAVWKRLEEKGRMDDFSKLTATFLRHFKGSQIRIEELRSRASSVSSHNRTIAYVDVFASIFEEYQRALKTQGDIDFEDMIALSTGYVATGRFVSPYGYILVDEFQDISVGRAKLLKALLEQRPNNQLFAVGDDWQAIFRFAGSDISLMRDFTANFGVTARTDLEETFRCVDRVSDVASKFVLRNRAQLAKTVRAVSKASGPSIFIGRPAAYGHGILRETLSRIVEHARGANVGVLLLGRYNNCKPKELRELQEAFPSLKLRFKSAHASKGLEDDYVVVLELKAERMGFPTGMVDDPLFDLVLAAPESLPNAEERRLFYVALTRARRAVFLLADRSSPSPFVVELESGGYDVEIYGGNGQADDRCPNCKEGKLVIRRGSNGFFIGCSFYPLCEHKENVCPSCQLGAVQRQSRGNFVCTNSKCRREQRMCRCGQGWMQRINGVGGKPFLGCSNYPKCKYKENVQ